MITQNAKNLIDIISQEAVLQNARAVKGFIPEDKVLGAVTERLAMRAKHNVDLKVFMETLAYIPTAEDERASYPWAEDLREPNDNFVKDGFTVHNLSFDDEFGLVSADVHTVPTGV